MSFDHDYFKNGKNVSKYINITLRKLEIIKGEKYDLNNHNENTSNDDIWGGGVYSYSPSVLEGIIKYNTTQIHTGELKITKFDVSNSIISGTFWFDAVNEEGETVEIREGRFDMKFTN